MNTITLKISGMSCNHCVMRVENALKGLNGVEGFSVSLDDNQSEVTYDEMKVDRESIVEAIKEAGYEVTG